MQGYLRVDGDWEAVIASDRRSTAKRQTKLAAFLLATGCKFDISCSNHMTMHVSEGPAISCAKVAP